MHERFRGVNGWRLLVGALIAYGSLYPFQFVWPDSPTAALAALFHDSRLWSSRGDVAGNLLLFVPWGALQASTPAGSRWHWPSFAGGLALALILQVLQIGLPSRDAALSDVFWNGVGILVGQFLLHPFVRKLLAGRGTSTRLDPALVLPLLWLGLMALPLLPSLDWQALKSHLRVFLGPSAIGFPELLLAYAGVLVVGSALASRFPPARALVLLGLIIALAAAAKLLTLHNALYRAEMLSWCLGWASAVLLIQFRPHWLNALAFGAMLLGMTLSALAPFDFTGSAGTFNLLPFVGYLRGDMLGNLRELAQTAWVAVAILWLGARIGGNVRGLGGFLVFWVLLLEFAQMWIVGRSADITPALTTLIVSLLMRDARFGAAPAVAQPSAAPIRSHPIANGGPVAVPNTAWHLPWRSPLGVAGLALWILAILALSWLVRQPGVPYNLRELFLGNGNPLAIAVFTLALLWIGAGSWLAVRIAAATRHPWLSLPALLIAGGVVSLMLLKASVTDESIMDIAGSTNLHWMVVNKFTWGTWWAGAFRDHIALGFVAPIERVVRYLALYLPPSAFLAVALLAAKPDSQPGRGVDALKAGIVLLPLLWLCKAIAFDWSSTDNLNELITASGAFGLGGGVYLYLLLGIAAANMAALGQAARPRALVATAVLTVLCLPVSWFLLAKGLSPAVEKYGMFYSGVQFLLGPDRKEALPESILQLRWTGLYLGLQLVGAAGIRLARGVFLHGQETLAPPAQGSRQAPTRWSLFLSPGKGNPIPYAACALFSALSYCLRSKYARPRL